MGVAKRRAFWHSIPRRQSRHTLLGCGCSSGVEHDLAKVGVEGSNPFARSKTIRRVPAGECRSDCLLKLDPDLAVLAPDDHAGSYLAIDKEVEAFGNLERGDNLQERAGLGAVSHHTVDDAAAIEGNLAGLQHAVPVANPFFRDRCFHDRGRAYRKVSGDPLT